MTEDLTPDNSSEFDESDIPNLGLLTEPTDQELNDLRDRIIEWHDQVQKTARDVLKHAIAVGNELRFLKSSLGHGKFMPFVGEFLPFSHRKATLYLGVAYRAALMGGKLAADANLSWADMSLAEVDRKLRELHEDAIDKGESLADAIEKWAAPSLNAEELDFARPDIAEQTIEAAIASLQGLLSAKKAREAETQAITKQYKAA